MNTQRIHAVSECLAAAERIWESLSKTQRMYLLTARAHRRGLVLDDVPAQTLRALSRAKLVEESSHWLTTLGGLVVEAGLETTRRRSC